jgi:hypothetical protein
MLVIIISPRTELTNEDVLAIEFIFNGWILNVLVSLSWEDSFWPVLYFKS